MLRVKSTPLSLLEEVENLAYWKRLSDLFSDPEEKDLRRLFEVETLSKITLTCPSKNETIWSGIVWTGIGTGIRFWVFLKFCSNPLDWRFLYILLAIMVLEWRNLLLQ